MSSKFFEGLFAFAGISFGIAGMIHFVFKVLSLEKLNSCDYTVSLVFCLLIAGILRSKNKDG